MHVTDDSIKLKLFMDVLDGTKAAVSHIFLICLFTFFTLPFVSD